MPQVKENIYSTSDFNLAVYLLHKGVRLLETKEQEENRKCIFILEIPEELDFSGIIKEWHGESTDVKTIKHILHTSRYLKSEVKRALRNPAAGE